MRLTSRFRPKFSEKGVPYSQEITVLISWFLTQDYLDILTLCSPWFLGNRIFWVEHEAFKSVLNSKIHFKFTIDYNS